MHSKGGFTERFNEPRIEKHFILFSFLYFKMFSAISVLLLVFGTATTDFAVAGEKFRAHGVAFFTNWNQIEVGDEEGHVLAIFEEKALYIDEKTGEKTVDAAKNLMDINFKTGQGTMKGYGVETFPNGDKVFRVHEGKPVGKGHWKGTWSILKGTGKHEGVKGGGTGDSYSIGKGQPSYVQVEGEMEMPGQ